ncbi:hypothetical protein [Arenivirga flava]|uniref:hypothetical protein n=1 Tax=Arenivirga flava TaxID=1930060 RepID=UPI0024E0CC5D|nr:hypothetical protein [Arenivirga flava]
MISATASARRTTRVLDAHGASAGTMRESLITSESVATTPRAISRSRSDEDGSAATARQCAWFCANHVLP